MPVSSEKTLMDTPRSNAFPALWVPFNPVKVTPKISHYNSVIYELPSFTSQ
jgi:hypothetical protein